MKSKYNILIIISLSFFLIFSCNKENDKINILVSVPFTGEAAAYGNIIKQGIEIGLNEIDDLKVKGKINVIYQDDKLSTSEAVSILQQEIANNPISVVMPVSTGITTALAPICDKNKIILLPPLADGDNLTKLSNYVYLISPVSSFQGSELAKAIIAENFHRVCIIYLNDVWGESLSNYFSETFFKMNGTILDKETCTPGQKDFRAIINKIKLLNPDALLVILHPAETIPVMKQIKELGLTMQIFGADTFSDKSLYTPEILPLVQNVIFALPTKPSNPAFNKFNKLYKQKYSSDADINAAAARDAILLIAKAIDDGATDGRSIKVRFDSYINGYNGSTGLIKWDNKRNVVSKTYSLYKIVNNTYNILPN